MKESKDRPRVTNALNRDWTKDSIFRNLLSLSWPIIISQSLNILGPVIDMIWVGRLGAASIAGVGIAGMLVMLITSARMGLTTGTRAMVARFIGAGDNISANHVAQQAFIISAGYVLLVSTIGIIFTKPILTLFGLEADVISEGSAYMRIMFIGAIAMSFRMMTEAIMQASGDTVIPMRIAILFRGVHVALCPVLVFGLWIFPQLGVSGAAITNAISHGIGAFAGFWVLFTGRSRLRLSLSNFKLDLAMIWRIIKIGIPASIMTTERSFGDVILVSLLSPYGTVAVASHTLIQRIQAIVRMPSMGMGHGAGILVGQNLGADQPTRAARSAWIAVALIEILMVVLSLISLLLAEKIVGIFNADPVVVTQASDFLRIAAVGFLAVGIVHVMQTAITGAGDTWPPMLITLLNFWLLQIPLAILLPKYTNMGVYGIRWAIVIGMVVAAAAYMFYFWMGRWKRKKV